MTNKEKFLKLVSDNDSGISFLKKKYEEKNLLKQSQAIAIDVLIYLDKYKIQQEDFAKKIMLSKEVLNDCLTGKMFFKEENILQIKNILSSESISIEKNRKLKNKSFFPSQNKLKIQ